MKDKYKPHLKQIVDKLPLEKFIPAAFLVFLLLFVILTVIIYNSINNYRENIKWVNHTHTVLNVIDDITISLTQMQLDRRGYIVKADSRYLAEYYNNKNKVKEKFIELKKLVDDNPTQLSLVSKMDSLSTLSSNVLDSSISYFDNNNKDISANDVQRNLSMDSQDHLDKVFLAARDLKFEETSLLETRQLNANQDLSSTQLFIIYTSLFVFLVLGLTLYVSTNLIRNKNIAERLLKKSYDELEDKVEERTTELKSTNQSLVTEIQTRVKVEKSLRESEERFRELADSSPSLIWMTDKNKLCTYLNKGWLDYTGRSEEEELGTGWTDGIYPNDRKRTLDTYNKAFDKREAFEMEFRLKTATGDYRWVLNKGIPRYEGNEFIGYVGSCLDIQSKKKNERYLRIQYSVSKSLNESRSIQEALDRINESVSTELEWDMGVIWLVEKGKLRQCSVWAKDKDNRAIYTNLYDENYTMEKGIGLPGRVWKLNTSVWVQDLITENNIPRKEGFKKLGIKSGLAFPISGTEFMGVIESFNKASLSPKDDLMDVLETVGRQIGAYIEKKNVEIQLKESHEELESRVKDRTVELAHTLNKLLSEIEQKESIQNKLKLFGHAIKGIKECVYITDLDNNTLFVNSAFEEIYGYYEEELIGKKIPILFSNVEVGLRNEILTQSIRGGWKGELRNKRKNGEDVDIYLSTSAVRNDEGKVQALVGICQDITESLEQKQLMIKRNGLLKLLNDVIIVTNRSFNIEASVSYAINKMCEYTDWDIGHCFFVENGELKSSNIWNGNFSSQFLEFKKYTESASFTKGEGIPGMVLESKESYWVKMSDMDEPSRYKRSGIAKKAGLKTGVWAPIKNGGRIVAVLEFFNTVEKEQDDEILDSINNIGIELGSLFERNDILNKIRESEENVKLLIENVKDYAIIRLDVNGNIASWNTGAEQIKGYKADEIIGKHFSIFYTEDELKANEPEENLMLARKHTRFEREGWRVRKDGSLFFADIIFTVLYDTDNNVIGYVKVTRDITQRKKSEETIIESEKRLKEAQKIAKLGSWDWDVKSDKVTWSEEMYNIFEIEAGTEITNDIYMDMLDEENKAIRKNALDTATKGNKEFNYYLKIKTRKGRIKILNSLGKIEIDQHGDVARLVGTIIDVTDVKEAEEMIKKSEKQLKEAQKIAKLGSWEVDVKTNTITWSEEMYNIYEMDPSEKPLPYEKVRPLIHQEDLDYVDNEIKKLEQELGDMAIDFRVITKQGRLKYLANDIRVQFGADNQPIRLYGSVQDITEIKLVEEELRKANAKLIEAQKELVHNEKLAALGRFSSGIAHEIRNPLANISALAQLLSKSKIEDEKMKKHLKYILVNADIANNIIKDLLHFASPEDLVFKKENICTILENIVNSVEPRCLENKVMVTKKLNIEKPEIFVDKTRLENALLNFISNSIDAMTEGGNLTVNAEIDKTTNEVVIDVIDTGEGIPPENLDKIFEPFFTTKESGTGLGLGLAYQTIKLHQGILNISSEPGKGTHVEIKLPIRKN